MHPVLKSEKISELELGKRFFVKNIGSRVLCGGNRITTVYSRQQTTKATDLINVCHLILMISGLRRGIKIKLNC